MNTQNPEVSRELVRKVAVSTILYLLLIIAAIVLGSTVALLMHPLRFLIVSLITVVLLAYLIMFTNVKIDYKYTFLFAFFTSLTVFSVDYKLGTISPVGVVLHYLLSLSIVIFVLLMGDVWKRHVDKILANVQNENSDV